jgi:hypothetical protein
LYANSDGIPTADEVYTQFKKQYSQEEADDILGQNTDHDELRKVGSLGTCLGKGEPRLSTAWACRGTHQG